MATKTASSFSSPFRFRHTFSNAQLSVSQFVNQQSGAQLTIFGKDKSYQVMHGIRKPKLKGRFQKQKTALSVVSQDQSHYSELKTADLVPENHDCDSEDISVARNSSFHLPEGGGKPGVISFYSHPYRRDNGAILSSSDRTQNSILWLVGPAALVTSFIFPSLFLRRLLRAIFENSLLTDFLMLFFTEAIFYCGVAVFLLVLDHLKRPMQLDNAANSTDTLTPQMGQRISSVATLVLSLTIPMVTMGLVWPWTGPAASATLAPYLVGIVIQFAFERHARHWKSPSWTAIPLIFQIYRLHQINRAAQLVTTLSATVRRAEMTSHNLAIHSSLGTLSNVLLFLAVICIWSLSSFLMRFLLSANANRQ